MPLSTCPSTSSLRKPCKKDVDARDNSRIKSGGRHGGGGCVADIKTNGGKAIAIKGDVAKAADVRRLFAETKKAFGTLDVLVNNAGVYKFQPLEEITEDEFYREFDINVLGTPQRKR